MDVNECMNQCMSQCLRGQEPDRPPDVFRIDAIVAAAEEFIIEADGTREWMLRNGFDPSNPSDVLLVISLLVTRRNKDFVGTTA